MSRTWDGVGEAKVQISIRSLDPGGINRIDKLTTKS